MTTKKGGSPTGDERAQIIDSIIEVINEQISDKDTPTEEKDQLKSKLEEIKKLKLKDVYLGAFNDDDRKYYIMRKPIDELAEPHIELLLELQGSDPYEETDAQGHTIRQVSPASKETKKQAMMSWFKNMLPAMMIYPDHNTMSFAQKFYMFNLVFDEVVSEARYFRPVR